MTAEEQIEKKKHYISHPDIPDYLRNVLTVEDVRAIIRNVRKEERAKRESYARSTAIEFAKYCVDRLEREYADWDGRYDEWQPEKQ